MARTNVYVDGSIFQQFKAEADRQNKSLYAFTNESLLAVSQVCSEGGSPSEIYSLWKCLSVLKQVDVMTLPSDFLDDLIEKIYNSDKAAALKMFGDLGASVVGLLKIAAQDLDGLASLAKDFMMILPIKQFNVVKEKEDGIVRKDGIVRIEVVGAGKKMASTECSFEFLKTILRGFGYSITKTDINTGTIRVWASQVKIL
jgi:hypothetical protein